MIRIFKDTFGCILGAFLFSGISVSVSGQSEVLVHWRFEQIQHLNGDSTSVSIVGQGVQAEQICYSTAKNINGPWSYGGYVSSSAKHGFTIHPSVSNLKGSGISFTTMELMRLTELPVATVAVKYVLNICTSIKMEVSNR